ncbi:PhoU domain-containing protein [Saccharopolyspora shandongensis]|uniref:PhoU domain-containing protein n=1 Tax=Saccharopolyspora shandongensis TaxID=418495 RepID=UPI0034212F86
MAMVTRLAAANGTVKIGGIADQRMGPHVLGALLVFAPWAVGYSEKLWPAWPSWIAGAVAIILGAAELPSATMTYHGIAGQHQLRFASTPSILTGSRHSGHLRGVRMREAFHGELAQLGTEFGGMCELAAEAMRQATQALLDVDLQLAEHVVAVDDRMNRALNVCDTHSHRLLALQQPVATDLRTVLAAVYCIKLERMGDLAAHIADTARRNHPRPVVPPVWNATSALSGSSMRTWPATSPT